MLDDEVFYNCSDAAKTDRQQELMNATSKHSSVFSRRTRMRRNRNNQEPHVTKMNGSKVVRGTHLNLRNTKGELQREIEVPSIPWYEQLAKL